MIADVICYCKMTSFMALGGVLLFLRLKTLQMHVNLCDMVFGAKAESWKKLKTLNLFTVFIVQ